MYSEAEGARLLGVSQSTLNYWLEGGKRRGRSYRPVIRVEPRGHRAPVTWAEVVEAGLLREYRQRNVPMAELRAFIEILRQRYGIPYPLADARPVVSERQLVIRAQDQADLAAEFCLVAIVRNQPLLTPPAEAFFERVTWNEGIAAAWRPAEDKRSPVLIDPEQRFGKPSVRGISTEAIWEHVDGGEDESEVADDYGLTVGEVRWALSYEAGRRAN
jgi:uncharacterized protein (DUF433 family)